MRVLNIFNTFLVKHQLNAKGSELGRSNPIEKRLDSRRTSLLMLLSEQSLVKWLEQGDIFASPCYVCHGCRSISRVSVYIDLFSNS